VTPAEDYLPFAAALDVDCFAGDLPAAARAVVARAASGKGGYAVLCNAHVLVTARHEAALREAIDGAWVVFPDGAPVAWLQRRSGAGQAARVPGPDLMPAVIALGREHGLRHYLFGSTNDVISRLKARMSASFPGAGIVGWQAPAPAEEDGAGVLRRIHAARPDIVWCALGAPKQELWMRRHACALKPALLVGVGAAFDFNSGTKQRAPRLLQAAGLEWLHRLGEEPRRLFGRYARTNSELVLRASWHLLRSGARRALGPTAPDQSRSA
jgi:N-acetylglucosaminyldiphosphoundecaprenol N-acetyl-beta-D-mannosaminyltransferase